MRCLRARKGARRRKKGERTLPQISSSNTYKLFKLLVFENK